MDVASHVYNRLSNIAIVPSKYISISVNISVYLVGALKYSDKVYIDIRLTNICVIVFTWR